MLCFAFDTPREVLKNQKILQIASNMNLVRSVKNEKILQIAIDRNPRAWPWGGSLGEARLGGRASKAKARRQDQGQASSQARLVCYNVALKIAEKEG